MAKRTKREQIRLGLDPVASNKSTSRFFFCSSSIFLLFSSFTSPISPLVRHLSSSVARTLAYASLFPSSLLSKYQRQTIINVYMHLLSAGRDGDKKNATRTRQRRPNRRKESEELYKELSKPFPIASTTTAANALGSRSLAVFRY